MNSENHTVKKGSEETLGDAYEQHMRQPVYEPLGSAEFNDLLEEVTELVHNQHKKANAAAAAAAAAEDDNDDDVVIMYETPARRCEPRVRQTAHTEV